MFLPSVLLHLLLLSFTCLRHLLLGVLLLLIHNPYSQFQRISWNPPLTQVFICLYIEGLVQLCIHTEYNQIGGEAEHCWWNVILYTLDIPEESPSLSHIDHDRDPERITPQEAEDPSVSEICQAIKTQIVGRHGASSTPPTVWFSSRLSELDAQLAALQNIADCLEMDFSKSRMVHKHVVFFNLSILYD